MLAVFAIVALVAFRPWEGWVKVEKRPYERISKRCGSSLSVHVQPGLVRAWAVLEEFRATLLAAGEEVQQAKERCRTALNAPRGSTIVHDLSAGYLHRIRSVC